MEPSLSRGTVVRFTIFAVLVVLPWIAHAMDDPFWITIATRMLIYGLAAMSLDLILGYGAMVSFGHAAFFGLGAYVVGVLTHHNFYDEAIPFLPIEWVGSMSAFVQWPLAMLVSGFIALLIGVLSLRTQGVYFIMITLAFAQMLYFFMIGLPDYGGEDGLNLWQRSEIPGLDLSDSSQFYYVVLVLVSLWFLLSRRVVESRFGRVLTGCRYNEPRMRTLGYPVVRYKLLAFTISAMGTGLAGALMANQNEFVSPSLMAWSTSGELMVMVILGGMGTLIGPLVGAFLLLSLEEVLAGLTEHWMVILGPLLVFSVLFARGGLYRFLVGQRDDE
jgi:branched-chain amino acid transport system permease protein